MRPGSAPILAPKLPASYFPLESYSFTYMPWGDSNTNGIPGSVQCWRNLLGEYFNPIDYPGALSVGPVATNPGTNTTTGLNHNGIGGSSALDAKNYSVAAASANLFIFSFGTNPNGQTRAVFFSYVQDCVTNIRALYPSAAFVFVVPGWIAAGVLENEVALLRPAITVDLPAWISPSIPYAIADLTGAAGPGNGAGWLAADYFNGVDPKHFSTAGHQKAFNVIIPTVLQMLAVGRGAPANTIAPVLVWTVSTGTTPVVTPGTWVGAPTLTYTLYRDGVAVVGQTGRTFAQMSAYARADLDIATAGVYAPPVLQWREIATYTTIVVTHTTNTVAWSHTAAAIAAGYTLAIWDRGSGIVGATSITAWMNEGTDGLNFTGTAGPTEPTKVTIGGVDYADFDKAASQQMTGHTVASVVAAAANQWSGYLTGRADTITTNQPIATGYNNESFFCDRVSGFLYPFGLRNNAGTYSLVAGDFAAASCGAETLIPALATMYLFQSNRKVNGDRIARVGSAAANSIAHVPGVAAIGLTTGALTMATNQLRTAFADCVIGEHCFYKEDISGSNHEIDVRCSLGLRAGVAY